YVEGLLERYQTDPKLVDESWQDYFSELLQSGTSVSPNGGIGAAAAAPQAEAGGAQVAKKQAVPVALASDTTPKALTGAAKKIVENMEQSLTVPVATSSRTVPVKLLEENRRIVNEHLGAQGRGKISFTHIIAWAIVKALKEYPHLNFGYGNVDGAPSRLEHDNVNL